MPWHQSLSRSHPRPKLHGPAKKQPTGFGPFIFALLFVYSWCPSFFCFHPLNDTRPCSLRQMRFFAAVVSLPWFLHPVGFNGISACSYFVSSLAPPAAVSSALLPPSAEQAAPFEHVGMLQGQCICTFQRHGKADQNPSLLPESYVHDQICCPTQHRAGMVCAENFLQRLSDSCLLFTAQSDSSQHRQPTLLCFMCVTSAASGRRSRRLSLAALPHCKRAPDRTLTLTTLLTS